MGESKIEYVDKQWSVYTGCLHTREQCPTVDLCWARSMSRRFKAICGGDFQPRFHEDRINEPYFWRKSYRVATCFMGDLFGDWGQREVNLGPALHMHDVRHRILTRVRDCKEHTFLFLTKNPATLAEYNPWPSNAWVGCTITGAETPQRQEEMLEALGKVEGGKRWVSYEPVLGGFYTPLFSVDWLVVGAQTGPGAKKPLLRWIKPVVEEADEQGIPIWLKKSLAGIWPGELRQEAVL